jgi:hypothetical protein
MQTLNPGGFAEGEPSPPFRVAIKGEMQEGGFNTYEEAFASVKHLISGVHIQIWRGRELVFGKPLPLYGSDEWVSVNQRKPRRQRKRP